MRYRFTRLICVVFGTSEWLPGCYSTHWAADLPSYSLNFISPSNRQVLWVVPSKFGAWRIGAVPETTQEIAMLWYTYKSSINVCIRQGDTPRERLLHSDCLKMNSTRRRVFLLGVLHFAPLPSVADCDMHKEVSLKLYLHGDCLMPRQTGSKSEASYHPYLLRTDSEVSGLMIPPTGIGSAGFDSRLVTFFPLTLRARIITRNCHVTEACLGSDEYQRHQDTDRGKAGLWKVSCRDDVVHDKEIERFPCRFISRPYVDEIPINLN